MVVEIDRQNLRAGMNVLGGIEQRAGTPDFLDLLPMWSRHHLHQAPSTNPAHGAFLKRGLYRDDGQDQLWFQLMAAAVIDGLPDDIGRLLFGNTILALNMSG